MCREDVSGLLFFTNYEINKHNKNERQRPSKGSAQ